jgi:hypothetical protein
MWSHWLLALIAIAHHMLLQRIVEERLIVTWLLLPTMTGASNGVTEDCGWGRDTAWLLLRREWQAYGVLFVFS